MKKRVLIVGAGPAGLMAAGIAAERGREVFLFEKNGQTGKKLALSGKGRCNITNNTDIEGLIRNIPGNGKFLYSTFNAFSNKDIIKFFNKMGLETKVERGGRIFPLSDKALDVVELLNAFAEKNGSVVYLGTPVQEIAVSNGLVTGLWLKNGDYIGATAVILATGGLSYPGTGSTGDGYRMAQKLGHSIAELKPSLVPLLTLEKWAGDLQGLSLKNIAITAFDNKSRQVYKDFGELMFTHFGLSGPVVLSLSRHILKYNFTDIRIVIDLKPALSIESLDERIRRDFDKFVRKQYKNSLDELLPQKMIPVIITLSGIKADKPVNQITKTERRELAYLLKNLTLNITGSRPVSEAIVTAGGVSTDEIHPATMESKLIKGLFFAGEIIDTDGYTGGYNLTIAFSTGYTAGTNC